MIKKDREELLIKKINLCKEKEFINALNVITVGILNLESLRKEGREELITMIVDTCIEKKYMIQ